MAEFRLTEAQAAVVAHEGSALLISAGAGSGKTRVLVERLLARLSAGGSIDRYLIITYTRAAAAELRSRILEAIRERLRSGGEGANNLRRQILLLPQARIGTIHAFCSSLLREYARMLDIRPDFRLLEEGARQRVLQQETLQEVLADRYENMTPAFGALVDALSSGESDQALSDVVLETFEAVQSHPDPEAWLTEQMETAVSFADAGETIWGGMLIARAKRLVRFWRGQMEEVLDSLRELPGAEKGYGPAFRALLDELEEFETALAQGWDAAAGLPPRQPTALKRFSGSGTLGPALRAKARREACLKVLDRLRKCFGEDSAALAEDMAAVAPVTGELLALVRDFSHAYAAEKRRLGLLDFSDLEHLALRLLTRTENGRRVPTEVARELSERFDEILVDEYQDCNRVQDALFFAVSREGRGENVTMVGDVKQSIYRFRQAEPELFLRKYALYSDVPGTGPGRRILLPENFRSDRGILRPVNEFFSAVMSEELGSLKYGPEEALKPGPAAGDTAGAFRLFTVETDAGAAERNVAAEAEAAAGYVAWLLQSGMTVPEGDGVRPLQPRDVALLLRAARGRDGIFAEALQRRGIPAVCLKSADDLEDRPEVRWAVSLLAVIDNPRQDVPLLTALRSPVFRFSEDRLAEIRSCDRYGCFWEALTAAAENAADCRAVLDRLETWRIRSTQASAEELLIGLCAETGLRALAEAAEPGSAANLDTLIEAARSYAEGGREDLYSFMAYLRAAGEAKKTAVPTAPGGGDGVIVTTVHGAKGLEYPVVLLADLMHPFNRADSRAQLLVHPRLGVGIKRIDRSRGIRYDTLAYRAIASQIRSENDSEELRILYVAMTRARQHLALFCRVKDAQKSRKDHSAPEGLPLPAEELESAASPGDWVLTASLALEGREDWAWQTPPSAERWTPPKAAEAPAEAVDPALVRARLDWKYAHPADARLPSKLTATAVRDTFTAEEAAEGATQLPERRRRPSDFPPYRPGDTALTPGEKGTAVHLALQYADLDRCVTPEGAAEALEELRRKRLLTEAQCAAVDPEKLRAFCTSRVMALLRQGTLHREFKFSLLAPVREFLGEGDGETLLQGVVDLWSELPEGILLLDYKTDRVTAATQAARAEEYAPQLRVYARALEKITGKPVLRRFIWFFATESCVELPSQGREGNG